jgi:hypothetical protein
MSKTLLETLRDTGGFTYNLSTMGYVTKGFAVSVNPECTRVIDGPVDAITLLTYASDNALLLDGREGKMFGAWLDTETGKTYLDVVTVFEHEWQAAYFGTRAGEIAIYDLGTGKEIRL